MKNTVKGKCIIWSGYITTKGYGLVYAKYSKGKTKYISAHRALYEGVFGRIHDDLVVDHLCRNRACINVNHLEAVTNRENILRGVGRTAVNARKTHCHNGHEFSKENTKIFKNTRNCKICVNAGWRRRDKAKSVVEGYKG